MGGGGGGSDNIEDRIRTKKSFGTGDQGSRKCRFFGSEPIFVFLNRF